MAEPVTLAHVRPLAVHDIIARRMAAAGTIAAAPRNDGHLHWHDTSIAVWEEQVDQESLLRDVMGPMIRDMRSRGWRVGPDPRIVKHYACLKRFNRLCRLGELRASIELAGRTLRVELWQERYNVTNRNGGRHDHDKLRRMPYLLRMRAVLEMARIAAHLHRLHGYPLGGNRYAGTSLADLGRPGMTALQYIERLYAESCHRDPATGRPRGDEAPYNNRSGDGGIVRHGATVWFADRSGRWIRGTAYYGINNIWRVVTGPYSVVGRSSFEIHVNVPASLRRQRDPALRRKRLEQEMTAAVRRMDYLRAETLRRILFADAELFRIWSEKQGAWYAPQSQGYTTDTSRAGLYRRDEAERACRGIEYLRIVPATAGASAHA